MRCLVSSAYGLDAFDGVFTKHLGQHLVAGIAVAAPGTYDVCHDVRSLFGTCTRQGV